MAEPHTIPSKLNTSAGALTPLSGDKIYITAILFTDNLMIDGVAVNGAGPVALPSPIICSSVTTSAIGQIAYFTR